MWSDLLQTHAYWVLALGCLVEGETLLVLAGFAAHRGLLDPIAVVSIAAVAGFAGDQAYFWLGRRHGARIGARWPLIAEQSARVNELIARWHESLIIGVRFAYGLRIAGPVLIGMSPVSAWRFALFNALGAVLWALAIAALGWLFGAAAEAWLGEIRHLEGRLMIGLAVALAIVWWIRHARQRRRGESSGNKP